MIIRPYGLGYPSCCLLPKKIISLPHHQKMLCYENRTPHTCLSALLPVRVRETLRPKPKHLRAGLLGDDGWTTILFCGFRHHRLVHFRGHIVWRDGWQWPLWLPQQFPGDSRSSNLVENTLLHDNVWQYGSKWKHVFPWSMGTFISQYFPLCSKFINCTGHFDAYRLKLLCYLA